MKGEKLKKVIGVILNILLYAFFVVCIAALALSIFSKRDADGAVTIFGRQLRIVVSSSMERNPETDVSMYEIKDIPLKSMVFISVIPEDEEQAEKWYSELKVGDVLTFKYTYAMKQETMTHRIVSINKDSYGGYIITLRGDNKSDADVLEQTIYTSDKNPACDPTRYVIGKVTGQSRLLGLIVYAISRPLGLALIIIMPSAIILIFEVIRIVNAINAGKKNKLKRQTEKQQSEIDELKRQLEEMKKTAPGGGDAGGTKG